MNQQRLQHSALLSGFASFVCTACDFSVKRYPDIGFLVQILAAQFLALTADSAPTVCAPAQRDTLAPSARSPHQVRGVSALLWFV